VSNFQPAHLDRIIAETGVVPAVNQIEIHPYFANHGAREASLAHGIAIQACSPLGRGKLLDDPVIGRVAAVHGKSDAQVILRWHLQHGHAVIPKSCHLERMVDNLDLFDFELSPEEVTAIDALDRGADGRTRPDPDTFQWVP
jgi:2,5-diketo-D-gluconate reductase A